MKALVEGYIYSHIVFALKNSRYYLLKIRSKNAVGFIASTYPFFEGREEEQLVDDLCNTAKELDLEIIEINYCGDHVHAIIKSESQNISKQIGLWKGKTAYIFNGRKLALVNNPSTMIYKPDYQSLWAKSYFQKIIKSEEELSNVKTYIKGNRKKHGLLPFSNPTIELIQKLLSNKD
jgi:REP element-mobilizing transposase RayT